MDPRTLRSIRLKYEICPWGPKCGTYSRGLSPKATELHLVGVGGDTLGSTLALPATWAEVGGSNGGPSDFAFYTIKIGNLALGSQVRHGFSGLKSKATGLHLVGVGGNTLGSTLAFPASWDEVGGSNGGPSDFGFYTIKIGNLALGSQVRHGFSGLKSKGNGVTPSRCWMGHPGEHTGTSC